MKPSPPPVFCLNPSHFSRYNILAALGIKPQTTNSGGLLNAPVRLFGNRWKYRRSSNVHGLSDDLMNTNIAGTCRNLDVCRKGISTAQPFPTVDLLPIRVEFFFKGYKVWRSLWSSSWTTCHSQGSFHLSVAVMLGEENEPPLKKQKKESTSQNLCQQNSKLDHSNCDFHDCYSSIAWLWRNTVHVAYFFFGSCISSQMRLNVIILFSL